MKELILLAPLVLCACAPKLAFSNEAGGVIDRKGSAGQGYQLAEAHCAKFGKHARITGRDILSATTWFEFVA